MIEIKRNIGGVNRSFEVYTKDDTPHEYVYWKEGYPGDWCISDDGYIGECLERKDYKTRTFVKMSHGCGWVTPTDKFMFEPNYSANIYYSVKPRHWVETEARKQRTQRTVAAYVQMMLSNKGIDWGTLGNIYRPDEQRPDKTVKRLFKQEKIKSMVDKKLEELLADKGITEGKILDLYNNALNMAEAKNDVGNYLRAVEKLTDMLDMMPSKKITTNTVELDYTGDIMDAIEGEDKRVKLEQKIEEDNV
jgi:hypothetical protein